MPVRAARFCRSLLFLTVLAYAACSDPTAPRIFTPSLEIVSGATATDTIQAYLAVPLAVIVHDSTGKPPFHAPITFRVVPIAGVETPALVSPTTYVYGPGPQTAMAEWTDSTGRAAVTVRLGSVAGQIRIAIDGVESNAIAPSGPNGKVVPVHDTVTYTVLPGAAVALDVQPSDTSLYVGKRYQLRARSLDRAGNSRPDQISLAGGDSVLALDGTLGATGRRFGRDFTDVASPTHRARVWTSVVPTGTIAVTIEGYALDYGAVGVVNLDGSGRRRIFGPPVYPSTAHSPRWSPDGKSLALVEGGKIYLVDAATANGRRITDDTIPGTQSWPTFSPDGRWIYYSTAPYESNQYTLWRVLVDIGSTPEQLPIPMQFAPHQADLSPDGTHLAYFGPSGLHELTLADSSDRTIAAVPGGSSPRYSHDGSTLAYVLTAAYNDFNPASGVYTIPVQGSTAQRITPPVSQDSAYSFMYTDGNTWSPDSEWIVSSTLGRLQVVNVKTGLTLPLPWSYDYAAPDWKPR